MLGINFVMNATEVLAAFASIFLCSFEGCKADPCPNKFLKISALSDKMTVYKVSHRQEAEKAHGAERAF